MPRLLIIDDDERFRVTIVAVLECDGFEVLQAGTGEAGLELARAKHPDLVLCDIRMPGLDGYATLLALRSDPAMASIPFILMTGYTDDDRARQSAALGAAEYLTKPFLISDLKATIRALLPRRGSQGHKRS